MYFSINANGTHNNTRQNMQHLLPANSCLSSSCKKYFMGYLLIVSIQYNTFHTQKLTSIYT